MKLPYVAGAGLGAGLLLFAAATADETRKIPIAYATEKGWAVDVGFSPAAGAKLLRYECQEGCSFTVSQIFNVSDRWVYSPPIKSGESDLPVNMARPKAAVFECRTGKFMAIGFPSEVAAENFGYGMRDFLIKNRSWLREKCKEIDTFSIKPH